MSFGKILANYNYVIWLVSSAYFFFDKPDEAAILKVKHRENGFFAWFNLKLKIKNINLEKF